MTSTRGNRSRGAILCAVAILLVGWAGTTQAQSNVVYVNTNIGTTPNANAVAAYSNDGAGNLTSLAGSPYLTGGTGVAGTKASSSGAYDADQEIIVNPSGTLLLAVNGHSNTVASFTINSDGALTAVAGSPFPADGRDPASLGLFSNFFSGGVSLLTVVDKDADPRQTTGSQVPRYNNYKLSSSGVITPILGTAIYLPTGTNPSQAVTDVTAKLEFTDEFMAAPGTITARMVAKGGKMVTVSSVPSPDGELFLGEVMHPTQNIIYVTMPATNALAVLTFDTMGNLTLAGTVANAGNTICWLAINEAGTVLYTGNNGDGTVSVFDLTNPTSPVEIQLFQLSGTAPHTFNVGVDPTQQFLYALTGAHLHVLTIDPTDGTLSEVAPVVALPMPTGNTALGIATLALP